MKKLLNIAIIVLVSYAVTLFALNTPAYWHNVSTWFGNNLGSISLTDITTGTQISAYPAIQTANNTLLETEINNLTASTTDTSLTTAVNLTSVGALSSGSLASGFTAVTVPIGGTGATTLTSGGALYGNGTGTIQATAACSNGEVISWTSGVPGCGSVSVNQTLAYDWTNLHTFTNASSTLYSAYKAYFGGTATSTFNVDGTLTLLGAYTLPSADGTASSTVISSDGAGNSYFVRPPGWLLAQDGAVYSTSDTSTTTFKTVSIPANTLVGNHSIEITTLGHGSGGNANKNYDIQLGNGTASTTIYSLSTGAQGASDIIGMRIMVQANDSSSVQTSVGNNTGHEAGTSVNNEGASMTYTGTGTLYLSFRAKVVNGSDTVNMRGISVKVY